MFSLKFLLFLNKTKIPTPEPAESPPTSDPKWIMLFTYILTSKTEDAQFGISPMAAVIIGCKNMFELTYWEIVSSEKIDKT